MYSNRKSITWSAKEKDWTIESQNDKEQADGRDGRVIDRRGIYLLATINIQSVDWGF